MSSSPKTVHQRLIAHRLTPMLKPNTLLEHKSSTRDQVVKPEHHAEEQTRVRRNSAGIIVPGLEEGADTLQRWRAERKASLSKQVQGVYDVPEDTPNHARPLKRKASPLEKNSVAGTSVERQSSTLAAGTPSAVASSVIRASLERQSSVFAAAPSTQPESRSVEIIWLCGVRELDNEITYEYQSTNVQVKLLLNFSFVGQALSALGKPIFHQQMPQLPALISTGNFFFDVLTEDDFLREINQADSYGAERRLLVSSKQHASYMPGFTSFLIAKSNQATPPTSFTVRCQSTG